MSTEYPQHFPALVNPWRMAENQQTLEGSIPLRKLPRLSDLLLVNVAKSDIQGEVLFTANFGISLDKRQIIQLRVQANVPLQCQRSLQVYLHTIDHEVELSLLDAKQQDDADDGTDAVLVESSKLAIAEVVEDELILSLPLVAVNPENPVVDYHCQDEDYTEPERTNPFAVLQKSK